MSPARPRTPSRLSPLALGALGLCLTTGYARGAAITDLRLVPSGDGARVEVGLTGAVTSSVFTLEHPARVVIDLKPATLDRRRVSLP